MAQRGINKVILVGNVGADPDVKTFDDNGKIANVNMATSENWKDKDGNPQERTEWHRVVFKGGIAGIVESYVKKGSKLYIEGKLQTRKWQDQEGKDHYTTEVVVDRGGQMQMLDSVGGGSSNGSSAPVADNEQKSAPKAQSKPASGGDKKSQSKPANKPAQSMPEPVDDFDDDIPF